MKGYIKLTKKEIEALANILASGKNKFVSHIINKYKQNADPFKIVYTENKIDKSLYYYVHNSENEQAKKNLDELHYEQTSNDFVENKNKAIDLPPKVSIKKEPPDESTLSEDQKSAISRTFGVNLRRSRIITPSVHVLEELCKQVMEWIVPDHDEIFSYLSLFNGTSKLQTREHLEAAIPSFQDSFKNRYEIFYKMLLENGSYFSLNKLRICLNVTILFLTGCTDKSLFDGINKLNLEKIKQLFTFFTDKAGILDQDLIAQRYSDLFIQSANDQKEIKIITYIQDFINKSIQESPLHFPQRSGLSREKSIFFSSASLLIPIDIPTRRKRSSSLPDTQCIKAIEQLVKVIEETKNSEEKFCNNMCYLIKSLEKVHLEEKSEILKKTYSKILKKPYNKGFLSPAEIQILINNPFKDFLNQDPLESFNKFLLIFSSWDFEERIITLLKIAKYQETLITLTQKNKQIQKECEVAKLKDEKGFNIYTHSQYGLNSLLIQPMQRIIRYRLLLKELLNHAKKANLPEERINKISYAYNKCEEYANNCNKLMVSSSRFSKKESFAFKANNNADNRNKHFTPSPG